MAKDKRAKAVKIIIETGNISWFNEIFDHFPKTALADALGIHFDRMSRMIAEVTSIKVKDIYLISSYFEVDALAVFKLIDNQKTKAKK